VRRAIALATLAAALAGCGGGDVPRADLRIDFRGGGTPASYTLRCPGRQACATLARHWNRYVGAHDVGWCAPAMASFAPSITVRIDGTWNGRPVLQRYGCSDAALTRWAALVGYRIVTGSP
jgi:hypothetical protein